MIIYIEYVLLDNFIIDYIILYASAKTLKLENKQIKLVLSAVIGTLFAVLLPLLKMTNPAILILKLLTGIIMVMLICPCNFKKIFITYIFFLTYTFVLGGSIIGALYVLKADIYQAVTLNYNYTVPIGLIIGICFVYILLLIKLVKYLERRKNILPFIRKIKIFYNDYEYESTGFIDSGNRVYDKNGKPVMIIGMQLAEKIIPAKIFVKLLSGIYKGKQFIKKEYITAQSKNSYMYIFKISKLWIYSKDKVNKIVNVSVGIVFTEFKGIENCQALLHSDMID